MDEFKSYINKLRIKRTLNKPDYNTLKLIHSGLKYKHSPETIANISAARTGKKWPDELRAISSVRQTGTKWSDEQRAIRSVQQTGTNNSFYGHKHTEKTKQRLRIWALAKTHPPIPGFTVEVLDKKTRRYKSI